MNDAYGRKIEYVRISVTNRCNLRCVYCMPAEETAGCTYGEEMSFEEIERTVRALARLGIRYVRVTGGEPMARRGCLRLIRRIRAIAGIEEIGMTTNALLLKGRVEEARRAGVTGLNISLDTLDAGLYRRMTRGGEIGRVLHTMDEALACGMRVKINAIPIRGLNEGGLTELAALARERDVSVRFIELMPIGCGAGWKGIASDEIEERLRGAFGRLNADKAQAGHGPARYVRPEGFKGRIGLISPMSHAFCEKCNRIRLTADGRLKLCLNHRAGIDVRALLRSETGEEALERALREAIAQKPLRHGWGEATEDREERRMNEIGG